MLQKQTPHWLWSFAILPLYVGVQLLSQFPNWIETYYSRGFYLGWAALNRTLWGSLPFSIGDLGYALLAAYLFKKMVSYTRAVGGLKSSLLFIGRATALLYLIFNLSWGLNYYRQPLVQSMGLSIVAQDSTALFYLTQKLIYKTNSLHQELSPTDSAAIKPPHAVKKTLSMAAAAFKTLGQQYKVLNYEKASVKKSLFAKPLSYMGYAGYLNPFSLEAQVNQEIPLYRLPLVATHEIGHQLGFASERDTNFIGYLAALKHSDPYFNYAATTLALSYCLRDLKLENAEKFERLMSQLRPGVLENYRESNAFWEAHENPLSPYFESLFNIFLKINHQTAGVRSYGQVVQLLLAYHSENPL